MIHRAPRARFCFYRNTFALNQNGFPSQPNRFIKMRNAFCFGGNGFATQTNRFLSIQNGFYPDTNGFPKLGNGFYPEGNPYYAGQNGFGTLGNRFCCATNGFPGENVSGKAERSGARLHASLRGEALAQGPNPLARRPKQPGLRLKRGGHKRSPVRWRPRKRDQIPPASRRYDVPDAWR